VARIVRADQVGEDTLIDEKETDHSLFEDTMKDREVASLRQTH
jgi:hypothetical protein